ncbi:uncharacterized protein N7483_009107 [Penicillium malachiteum]|uniref:uncharacterized protein n=1 Tax=Penicillium malachiteum TaxID=1324776 RepID=UPI00254983E5|nr:uncharacterized protein N7483_009107 [Penicillium malachiteum]KAJ5721173.1 hypothetical protein N7483_009107 [Penicillium malachiteum]
MSDKTTVVSATVQGVKLHNEEQWKTWFGQIKGVAERNGVWHLVDPSLPVEDVKKKILPIPEDDVDIPSNDATKEQMENWEKCQKLYNARFQKWSPQNRGLNAVEKHISDCVDSTVVDQLNDMGFGTTIEKLIYLKERFGCIGGVDVLNWTVE